MKRGKYPYIRTAVVKAVFVKQQQLLPGLLLYMTAMFITFIIALQQVNAQNVSGIREAYFSMKEDECNWSDITDRITDTADPVLLAYMGASLAASANCVDGALNKLKRFKEGKQKLEKAVDLNPENMEVRFLRYSVKVKTPGILNYNDAESDKYYILNNITLKAKTYDNFLLHEICSFMLNHGDLNESEKQKINNIYP